MKNRRRYNTNRTTLKKIQSEYPQSLKLYKNIYTREWYDKRSNTKSNPWTDQIPELEKKSICVLYSHKYRCEFHEKIYVVPKLDNTELYLRKGNKFVQIQENVYTLNQSNRLYGSMTINGCINNVSSIRPYGHCDTQYSHSMNEPLSDVVIDYKKSVHITHISTLGAPRIIKHSDDGRHQDNYKHRYDHTIDKYVPYGEIINCGKRYVIENDRSWVKTFQLYIRLSGKHKWKDLGIFNGNVDRYTEVLHKLPPFTVARYIRIVPLEYTGTKALQIGVFGNGVQNKTVNAHSSEYQYWTPYYIIRGRVWNCKFHKLEQTIDLPLKLKGSNVPSYTLSRSQKCYKKYRDRKQSHVISNKKKRERLDKYVKSL